MSGLITQMLTAGLIQRDTDPDDRRAAIVVLTAEGKKQLMAWETANERRVADALSRLTQEERAAIVAALPALQSLAAELR